MPSGPSETGSGSASGSGHGGFNQSLYSGPTPYGLSPYAPVVPAMGVSRPGPPSSTVPSVYSQSLSGHQTGPGGGGYVPSLKEREAFASRYAQQMGQGQGTLYGTDTNPGPAYVSPYAVPGVGYGEGSAPLTLMNPTVADEEGDSPSVVVHQDGGRIRDEDADVPLNEIPPTYDSIRSEEDDGVPRAR